MVNDDLEFCREIKARGCRIIHEVMLNPDIGIWLDEEHNIFRDIARDLPRWTKYWRVAASTGKNTKSPI